MLTLIDRNLVPIDKGVLSTETLEHISRVLKTEGKNILLYLNRRGAFRAYICNDCSYTWKCPNCDVSMTLHSSPKEILLCHHCHTTEVLPKVCPKCRGHELQGVGIAIQSVEEYLKRTFPREEVCRLDRDQKGISKTARIYLGTEYVLRHNIGSIGLAIALLPEVELNVPEYDIEERVYSNIRALGSISEECIIETHAPHLPLIQDIFHGNYKTFLTRTLAERKQYHYPPYSGLAYIQIKHKNIGVLEDTCLKLHNKLELRAKELLSQTEGQEKIGNVFGTETIRYDRSVRIKRIGEFIDTIMIRSDYLDQILEPVQKEVIRNRNIELRRAGEKIF